MQTTSAAKRLHRILAEAWGRDPNESLTVVWAVVLGADPENQTDVVEKFTDLIALIKDVRDEIANLEESKSPKFLKAIRRIQEAILTANNPIHGQLSTIVARVPEEVLDMLDACGDLVVADSGGVKEITSEELEELRREVCELIKGILDSDVDGGTKRFLIEKLRELERALINYQIRGSTGLKKISEQVVGEVYFFSQGRSFLENAKQGIGKALEIASKCNGAVSLAEKIPYLADGFSKFLN